MQQQGHSLIEFMITITISLFLLSILTMVFQTAKNTSQYVDNVIQTQEAIILFVQLLKQDLDKPNSQILNPQQTPTIIQQRIAKNTEALLIENKQGKIVYFITHTKQDYELHRKNLSQSLYLQDGLTNQIKNLQIKYGMLINHTLKFYSAQDISHWNKVKSIRIQIVFQLNPLISNKKPIDKNLSFVVKVA